MKNKINKILIRLFDKLLLTIIFSSFFIVSCEEPEPPAPEYGVIPMYGVPTNVVDKLESK